MSLAPIDSSVPSTGALHLGNRQIAHRLTCSCTTAHSKSTPKFPMALRRPVNAHESSLSHTEWQFPDVELPIINTSTLSHPGGPATEKTRFLTQKWKPYSTRVRKMGRAANIPQHARRARAHAEGCAGRSCRDQRAVRPLRFVSVSYGIPTFTNQSGCRRRSSGDFYQALAKCGPI